MQSDSRVATGDFIQEVHGKVNRELKEVIQKQAKKDVYFLSSGKISVPKMQGNVQGYQGRKIMVQNDADFYIYGVTGSYGYWTGEGGGRRLMPLPDNGFEEVTFRMSDGSSNRLITSDYVAVETFFASGGAGKPLYMVMPMKHIILRNSFLMVEFQNATANDFEIDFTLHGIKYF